MPRLSTLRGIVIAMYWDDHPPPHFHASYAGRDIVVSIDPLAWPGELDLDPLVLHGDYEPAGRITG